MAIGSLLRDRDIQYVAIKDDATKTWRILDTWSPALKDFDSEDDIPDDSAAVSIITEAAFIALIKEATRLGHNGTWEFKFSSPFYLWLLENLY